MESKEVTFNTDPEIIYYEKFGDNENCYKYIPVLFLFLCIISYFVVVLYFLKEIAHGY